MSKNTKELVRYVLAQLDASDIQVMLGGGWAEELHGIIQPRAHKDIDLYYISKDFSKVDGFIIQNNYSEIPRKHLPHKRAFLVNSIVVEIVLINPGTKGYTSNFWDKKSVHWPLHIADIIQSVNCLSVDALKFYRSIHDELFAEAD